MVQEIAIPGQRPVAPGVCWAAPDQQDVRVLAIPVYVAVIGVRARDVDLTGSVRMTMAMDRSAVTYPAGSSGYEVSPVGWFRGDIESRLGELSRSYAVLTCKLAEGGAAAERLEGSVNFSVFGSARRTMPVAFHRVGAAGWDLVQWLEVPDANVPVMGELHILNDELLDADPPILLITSGWAPGKTGVFQRVEAVGSSGASYRVRAPEGAYSLVHEGCPGEVHEVRVSAGRTTEVETRFRRQHYLTVSIQLPSGAAARGVGVYLRKRDAELDKWHWLRNVMEPLGCRDGSERFLIREMDRGDVQLFVKKAGFLPHTAPLTLGDGDAQVEVTLVSDPEYGW
jgi:hypothetical protein